MMSSNASNGSLQGERTTASPDAFLKKKFSKKQQLRERAARALSSAAAREVAAEREDKKEQDIGENPMCQKCRNYTLDTIHTKNGVMCSSCTMAYAKPPCRVSRLDNSDANHSDDNGSGDDFLPEEQQQFEDVIENLLNIRMLCRDCKSHTSDFHTLHNTRRRWCAMCVVLHDKWRMCYYPKIQILHLICEGNPGDCSCGRNPRSDANHSDDNGVEDDLSPVDELFEEFKNASREMEDMIDLLDANDSDNGGGDNFLPEEEVILANCFDSSDLKKKWGQKNGDVITLLKKKLLKRAKKNKLSLMEYVIERKFPNDIRDGFFRRCKVIAKILLMDIATDARPRHAEDNVRTRLRKNSCKTCEFGGGIVPKVCGICQSRNNSCKTCGFRDGTIPTACGTCQEFDREGDLASCITCGSEVGKCGVCCDNDEVQWKTLVKSANKR